jgi:hypothetical protein
MQSHQPDAVKDERQASSRTRRPIFVWIVSLYSIVWAVLSYVNLVDLFVTDPFASTIPTYQRLYIYFLPGLHLFAGIALFRLKKGAFPLYVAYFIGLLALPIVASHVYVDPYLTPNWVDIYKSAGKGIMGIGWLVALAAAGYVGYLHRRGTLK